MTLLDIAQVGHPVLKERARALTRSELASEPIQRFIDDLIETMRHSNGAGLAANQVFEPIQICAIEVGDNPRYPYKPKIPLTVLVNPVITPLSDRTFDNYEGCLSVPNLRGEVRRHVEIGVEAWDRHGDPLEMEVRGLSAGTFQHELDHLQGILFLDRLVDPSSLCTLENFDRFEKDAFVARAEALIAEWGA